MKISCVQGHTAQFRRLITRITMASLRSQKLAMACLAIICGLLVSFAAVEGKKKSSDPEITTKVRKKLSR